MPQSFCFRDFYESDVVLQNTPKSRWRKAIRLVLILNRASACFYTLRDMYQDPIIDGNKIRIVKKLGRGKFAQVQKCRYDGKIITVKYLQEQYKNTTEEVYFQREISILKKLRHPNVCRYVGTGHIQLRNMTSLFLAQECLKGGSLNQLCLEQCIQRNKNLYSIMDAYYWMLDVAKGMRYLHTSNPLVIHRDLKPDNIVFKVTGERPQAVIIDFGVHATISQRDRLEKQGTYLLTGSTGSYIYMAPEIFLSRAYNEKVDVFSFGVIMWEMFYRDMILNRVSRSGSIDELMAYCVERTRGYREPIPNDWPKQLQTLVYKCQHDKAYMRPDFCSIVDKLQEMFEAVQEWHRQSQISKGCCVIQ